MVDKADRDMVGSVSDTPTPPKIHTSVTVNRADGSTFHQVTSILGGLTGLARRDRRPGQAQLSARRPLHLLFRDRQSH